MSNAKHTPGPWSVLKTDTLLTIYSDDGIKVCSTSWHGSIRKTYPLKPESEANARMIAATPGLAEAAKGVLESRAATFKARNGRRMGIEDESGEAMWIVPFDEMAALEAAIAKAEGR